MSYQPNPHALEAAPEPAPGPEPSRIPRNRHLSVWEIADTFGVDALTASERTQLDQVEPCRWPDSTARASTTAVEPANHRASTGQDPLHTGRDDSERRAA